MGWLVNLFIDDLGYVEEQSPRFVPGIVGFNLPRTVGDSRGLYGSFSVIIAEAVS
jgi:hypothetical protein